MHSETNLRAVSPSVARACVTLPGFFPDVGASEAILVPHIDKYGNALIPLGTTVQHAQKHAPAAFVQPPTAQEDSGQQRVDAAVLHAPALMLSTLELRSADEQPLKQGQATSLMQQPTSLACTVDDATQSWIDNVALPKVRL